MGDRRTDFLFASPSFLSGAASVFCLSGSNIPANLSETAEEADRIALISDWEMIGQDFQGAAQIASEKFLANEKAR
jgi:hypothetical protein